MRRTREVDERGERALQVAATLTTSGSLVATVQETVYRRLFDRAQGPSIM